MMRRLCSAALLVLGLCAPLTAGEPARIDGTLFLCNFNSLTTADFAAVPAGMRSHGATLAAGKWGKGLLVGPGQWLAISPEGNHCNTTCFWQAYSLQSALMAS
jgi:hypothetical protein